MDMFELGEQEYSEADAEWDEFVSNHPHGSILQTTPWARLKSRFNWSPQRVWIKQEDKIVAGAQVLIKSAAFGMARIAYVPHGPLVDWENDEQVQVLMNQIDLAAYKNRAGILKLEPLLWQHEPAAERWAKICERYDLIQETDTIQPPRTVLVDLRPSEEQILSAMKQKTRYNIRLAEKKGVQVRLGTAADLPAFNQLMRATGQRNEFGVHAAKYYEVAYTQFADHLPNSVALFIAEYQTKPLAAIMVFKLGETAAYLYGASSHEERQRMPTYAVQWAAMLWAKAQGCCWYDLWGVPDYSEEKLEAQFQERDEGLWGVYRFKRGFGGQVVRTVGTADRVYNNLTYKLYKWRRG